MTTSQTRLCAIDLDDTLLNSDHAVSPRNREAVQSAADKGWKVVLATGRMHESALPYARLLELNTPIISYNGAMVRLAASSETWLHKHLPADYAGQILDYCRERHLQLNFYLNDLLYTAEYTPWMKLYHDRTGSPVQVLPDFYTRLRGKEPTKLIIIDAASVVAGLLPYFRERFQNELYVTRSNDEYLEFMPVSANKGNALKVVCERLGVEPANSVAFGDSWNDVSMLKQSGLGIAVSNAKPELLQVADRIVPSNNEDGVAVALEELVKASADDIGPRPEG